MDDKVTILKGVRVYSGDYAVELHYTKDERPVILTYNDNGNNHTVIDLWDLLEWLRKKKIEYLNFSYPK